MASNTRARQNKVKTILRKTQGKTSGTLERGPELNLADVIEWVNWVPRDARLPESFSEPVSTNVEFAAAVEQLPLPLRLHLLEILHQSIAQGRIQNPRLYRRTGTATFDDPEKEAVMRRLLVLSRYDDIRTFRQALHLILPLIRNEKIKYLRECPTCGKVFLAARENQWYWPTVCAKKQRQEKWASEYKKKHGHSYRRTREPRYLVKIRKALERWGDLFNPTLENKKDLAANADVTLRQCEEALNYIKKPTKTKRVKTAKR